MSKHTELDELETLWASLKFVEITATSAGVELLTSDVPEARIYYPVKLVISETTSAAETVQIQKVEEGGATTDIINNLNLAANETKILDVDSLSPPLPPLEGGTNLEFTTGTNAVEVTAYYIPNEV